jgi:hypothetical protein
MGCGVSRLTFLSVFSRAREYAFFGCRKRDSGRALWAHGWLLNRFGVRQPCKRTELSIFLERVQFEPKRSRSAGPFSSFRRTEKHETQTEVKARRDKQPKRKTRPLGDSALF